MDEITSKALDFSSDVVIHLDHWQRRNEFSDDIFDRAVRDTAEFWLNVASEKILWIKPPTESLRWRAPQPGTVPPWFEWFADGVLNVAQNCIDRHVRTWRRNKAAIIWEGEPGDTRVLTYYDLYREVQRCA
ncbi:MAG: hypothetical protein N2663_03755, partial [Chlorobi bacterium]|nr:hypothetical protein [Chlorobiota bacterium]